MEELCLPLHILKSSVITDDLPSESQRFGHSNVLKGGAGLTAKKNVRRTTTTLLPVALSFQPGSAPLLVTVLRHGRLLLVDKCERMRENCPKRSLQNELSGKLRNVARVTAREATTQTSCLPSWREEVT